MQIKLHKSGSVSVSENHKVIIWITPHAIERYRERESVDIEALCYRAASARRIPSREMRKFRRKQLVKRIEESGQELREHGDVIFVIDPSKPIVVTVLKSNYIK